MGPLSNFPLLMKVHGFFIRNFMWLLSVKLFFGEGKNSSEMTRPGHMCVCVYTHTYIHICMYTNLDS